MPRGRLSRVTKIYIWQFENNLKNKERIHKIFEEISNWYLTILNFFWKIHWSKWYHQNRQDILAATAIRGLKAGEHYTSYCNGSCWLQSLAPQWALSLSPFSPPSEADYTLLAGNQHKMSSIIIPGDLPEGGRLLLHLKQRGKNNSPQPSRWKSTGWKPTVLTPWQITHFLIDTWIRVDVPVWADFRQIWFAQVNFYTLPFSKLMTQLIICANTSPPPRGNWLNPLVLTAAKTSQTNLMIAKANAQLPKYSKEKCWSDHYQQLSLNFFLKSFST